MSVEDGWRARRNLMGPDSLNDLDRWRADNAKREDELARQHRGEERERQSQERCAIDVLRAEMHREIGAGSLKRSHVQFRNVKSYDVEIGTLDEAGLAGVRFVKADVEGGEREVLDGARATIARDRPIILLELLSGTHENPAADVAAICESFGYEAFIVQRGEKIAALPAISALGKNTSWGTDIESRNVLFLPR